MPIPADIKITVEPFASDITVVSITETGGTDPNVVLNTEHRESEHVALDHHHDTSYYTEPEVDSLIASVTPTWSNISDKPTEFTPISHGHDWSEVTGKPSVYPPDTHYHNSEYYMKSELYTQTDIDLILTNSGNWDSAYSTVTSYVDQDVKHLSSPIFSSITLNAVGDQTISGGGLYIVSDGADWDFSGWNLTNMQGVIANDYVTCQNLYIQEFWNTNQGLNWASVTDVAGDSGNITFHYDVNVADILQIDTVLDEVIINAEVSLPSTRGVTIGNKEGIKVGSSTIASKSVYPWVGFAQAENIIPNVIPTSGYRDYFIMFPDSGFLSNNRYPIKSIFNDFNDNAVYDMVEISSFDSDEYNLLNLGEAVDIYQGSPYEYNINGQYITNSSGTIDFGPGNVSCGMMLSSDSRSQYGVIGLVGIDPNYFGSSNFEVWGTTYIDSTLTVGTPQTYSTSNVTSGIRTYDANSTSVEEIADVLGNLISDLKTIGLVV